MTEQYVVVAFLDGTLTVDATGPFRSHEKAQRVCDQINEAGEWSEECAFVTIVAQVVTLRSVDDLLADPRMSPVKEGD